MGDASLLRRKLTAVDRGDSPLLPAIHSYEAEMLEYGFAAVHASLQNTRQAISSNRIALAALKTMLRICQAAPPFKRMLVLEHMGRPRT